MEKRNKIQLLTGFVFFSFSVWVFAKESGLSQEKQTKLINSLQNYQPLQSGASQSEIGNYTPQNDRPLAIPCPEVPYSDDKYCLEKKYINNGYYIVKIIFTKLDKFSEQPHAPLIKGVRPLKRDTTDRDIYLNQVSDEVFREYIGEDYNRFNKIELVMINRNNIVIELQVKEAFELEEVLSRPYINYVEHIGKPQARLEEY